VLKGAAPTVRELVRLVRVLVLSGSGERALGPH
jgi:hypothetical protein